MEKEWNKIFITPNQFQNDIIALSKLIPENEFKNIYGIPRGGSIVEVYLSHFCKLNVTSKQSIAFLETLIVDDIADTGLTLTSYKNFKIATVYYKPRSKIKPDYYVREVNNSDWIVFPWECNQEIPNREV